MHYIKTHILNQLITQKEARNRDLRPTNVESNLFQYHLKQLVKDGMVMKWNGRYRLDVEGLIWADQFSRSLKDSRPQPKVITSVAVRNGSGAYFLIPKPVQPFINELFLPAGKVHQGEELLAAAKREAREKLQTDLPGMASKGVVHVRIYKGDILISDVVSFMFLSEAKDGLLLPPDGAWLDVFKSSEVSLMPGTVEMLKHIERSEDISEVTVSAK